MPRSNITSRQKETISFLYKCNTFQQAARAARVGANTVQKWMTQPNFVEALNQMDDDLRISYSRRLFGLAGAAVDCIAELMDDSEPIDSVRLRAAQAILDYALRNGIVPEHEVQNSTKVGAYNEVHQESNLNTRRS